MSQLQCSEEFASGKARLRIDVYGEKPVAHVLDEMTFLNYRLADVKIEKAAKAKPDVIFKKDEPKKTLTYKDGTLTATGEWYQGEMQKILVSMLALKMEEAGLHPFHSSC